MDKISVIAIVAGLSAIVIGQSLEGGQLSSLLQLTALLIVIGGTFSAVMLQSTAAQFINGFKMAKWVFFPPSVDHAQLIREMVIWSNLSRKSGLLSLEPLVNRQKNLFVKQALQMLVDGVELTQLNTILENEIEAHHNKQIKACQVWESAGGYSPTFGILGAVLGLIHVMENLTDPSKLGSGIAVAFVATIYGVGFANLLFLPMAHKIKQIIEQETIFQEMVLEGILCIANAEHPRLLESKLRSLQPGLR